MATRGSIPYCGGCEVWMDEDFNIHHLQDCKRETGFSDRLLVQSPEWLKNLKDKQDEE